MNLRGKLWQTCLRLSSDCITNSRLYSSKVDFKKLRPMILRRIEERKKEYPVKNMVPVAQEVLNARKLLILGVSTLIKTIPVKSCKFCPEVYVGGKGHLIQTCHGYKHLHRNRVHEWINGGVNDILVSVETFHLQNMFQDVIKHHERFDFDRVPAVVELCWQAGADPYNENSCPSNGNSYSDLCNVDGAESLSYDDLCFIATGALRAWETLRAGVQKLLLVHPAKVCKHCSEVHVGPSGHKARLCGVFKYETWRGSHFWKKAEVDDLVPPKIVWRRRRQDPPVLLNEGRDFYGHAPAVVELCTQAGAVAPAKYLSMMKPYGISAPHR